MLIQVDVDSTLYDSDELFNRVSKDYGFEWPTTYDHWFKAEFLGTDVDNLLAMFEEAHGEKYIYDTVPYPYAHECLEGIAHDFPEVEIAYVSDRNEQLGEHLRSWLTQEGFLVDPNQHVVATKDKRHWMREHRPEIVIDDRVRTMLMARYELGSQVLSLRHPYNANLIGEAEGIYILESWEQIDEALRNIIPSLTLNPTKRYEVIA